jgi:hypothetical protein
MPSRLHEALVALIAGQSPAIKTNGWVAELRVALPIDGREIVIPRRMPDAFLIEPDDGRVTVWEVEVDGPLTGERLEEYSQLWAELDGVVCWELVLWTFDRHAIFRKVNLARLYYAFLAMDRPLFAALLAGEEPGG